MSAPRALASNASSVDGAADVITTTLLLHDRSGNDTISLTHEFLSRMLATRRAGITVAMGALSSAGAIEQARNRVRISDRRQLEAMSCECYESEVRDFENALGFRPIAKKRVSEID